MRNIVVIAELVYRYSYTPKHNLNTYQQR